jgi:hypothetical protein
MSMKFVQTLQVDHRFLNIVNHFHRRIEHKKAHNLDIRVQHHLQQRYTIIETLRRFITIYKNKR